MTDSLVEIQAEIDALRKQRLAIDKRLHELVMLKLEMWYPSKEAGTR